MEFLLDDVENIFMEKCKKSHSRTKVSTQGFVVSNSSINSFQDRDDECNRRITYERSTATGSGYNFETNSVEANRGESIHWEEGDFEASYIENDKVVEESEFICFTENGDRFDASLLENIRVVFPVVTRLYLDFTQLNTGVLEGISSPLLSLHPSSYEKLDIINLSSEESHVPKTWTDILREHAENSLKNREHATVSVLAIIISRIYFAATEAYFAELKEEHLMSTEDTKKNKQGQFSFKQHTILPDWESEETKNDDYSTAPRFSKVPVFHRKARSKNLIVNVKQRKKTKITKYDSGPLTSLLNQLSEICEKYSPSLQYDLDEGRSIFGEEFEVDKLPFVSLRSFLHVDKSNVVKVDVVLRKILGEAIEKAIQAGYFNRCILSPQKDLNDKVNYKCDEKKRNKDIEFCNVQYTQLSATGKKKKKKKKRKRKNSNTEISQGKETNALLLKTEQLSLKEHSNDTRNLDRVWATKSTKKKGTINRSVIENIPLLPVVNSFDTDRTGISSKDSSVNTDFGNLSQKGQNKLGNGIMLSRFDGIGPRCVVVPGSHSNLEKKDHLKKVSTSDDCGDDDQWETVEVKVRGKNRPKFNDSRIHGMNITQNSQLNVANGRKIKMGRTSASRKRSAHRKMARDILSSVLESVELEIRRRKKTEATGEEERKRVSRLEQQNTPVMHLPKVTRDKPISMRDMVLRKSGIVSAKVLDGHSASISQKKAKSSMARNNVSKIPTSEPKKKVKKTKSKNTVAMMADQNTAQTLLETLSGASGASNNQLSLTTEEKEKVYKKNHRPEIGAAVTDDSSSVAEVCEQEQNFTKIAVTTDTDSSPSPPLSTLLGPGNSNSASSSVASSLEAPHSSKRMHHSSCGNENDVGYHLLDVCNRLSRDMNVFMARRAFALTARRRERGALLAALQDTVSNIWSGHGTIELYGSCATQLDLPSSDVDAVILGLDPCPELLLESVSSCTSLQGLPMNNNKGESTSEFDHNASLKSQGCNIFNHNNKSVLRSRPYGRPSNGERVLILAAELERQPWAVQVKAIPTASVPVVKILADPSKIPGAVSSFGSGGDWMMQQHHMAAHAAVQAAVGKSHPPPPSQLGQIGFFPNATLSHQGQPPFPSHTPPPWRGSDVMNGLFKIDITFEGPEHGGIGSTAFTADVIRDACNESGLHAEGTPIAQVVMVLKELLAQRRLNEPFSGGLSSYALLLLVVGVVKERIIIREEMERMERHRELVVAEDTVIVTKTLELDSCKCKQKFENFPNKNEKQDIIEPFMISNAGSLTNQKQDVSSEDSSPRKITKEIKTESAITSKICNQGAKVASKNLPVKNLKTKNTNSRSTWASIAKKNSNGACEKGKNLQSKLIKSFKPKNQHKYQSSKVTSFAEAVSRKQETQNHQVSSKKEEGKKIVMQLDSSRLIIKSENNCGSISERIKNASPINTKSDTRFPSNTVPSKSKEQLSHGETSKLDHAQHIKLNKSIPTDSKKTTRAPSLFPQGSNDVLEVLCSGETTAGKLLMHFLLYYGEHFDSRTTAIDVVGNCNPNYMNARFTSTAPKSPFIARHSGGTIDPVTGMLTVDPIVVYDPWEGGRGSNVARSCYAWNSIRWHFGQCYMTLSSAIERSGTIPPTATTMMVDSAQKDISTTPMAISFSTEYNTNRNNRKKNSSINKNCKKSCSRGLQPPVDMVSPLLELLLSF